MKKRTTSRLICCLTAVVLLVSALVNMSGCGQGDAVSNLGTRFTPYDPQQFITQTSTPYLNSYLSPAAADDYLAVLAQAEQAVASDPELLARVQRVKTGALFTKAIQFSADMKGRQAALDEFMQICKDNGWNSLVEGESNGDELQQFYDSTRGQIRAMPAIILGMILGSAAIVAGVTLGTIAIVRLVRRRRARSYQQEAQA